MSLATIMLLKLYSMLESVDPLANHEPEDQEYAA